MPGNLTRGHLATEARTLTRGHLATEARTLTRGHLATEARTLTRGHLATEARTLTRGHLTLNFISSIVQLSILEFIGGMWLGNAFPAFICSILNQFIY